MKHVFLNKISIMFYFCILFSPVFHTQQVSAFLGIKRVCESVFKKNSVLFSNYDFKNPVSKTLVESYWLSRHLEFFANQNKKKQIKQWESGIKEVVEFLEAGPNQANPRLKQLSIPEVINQLPQIIEFVRKSPKESALSHRQTVQAIMAVITKFLPTVLKDPDIQQVHWNRIYLILNEIKSFDGQDISSSHFALYKINRAIEKWYSIKEFIRCRV